MQNLTCPTCGQPTTHDIRPMTVSYKGPTTTFDMPGWYCVCGEGILTGADMDVSDQKLNRLKALHKTTSETLGR